MTKRIIARLTALLLCVPLSLTGCSGGCVASLSDSPAEAAATEAAMISTEATEAAETTEAATGITPKMWTVTDPNGNTAYLFGSIHNADAEVLDLPDYFEEAYQQCDAIAFETVSTNKTLEAQTYTDGTTIADHISPSAYNFAKEVLVKNQAYSSSLETQLPAQWTVLLYLIRYRNAGYTYSVDSTLMTRAKRDRKELLELESPETHWSYYQTEPVDVQEWELEQIADEAAFSDLSDYTEQISKWKSGTLTYSDEAESSDMPTEAELAAMSEAERRDYQMQKAYSDWVLDVNGKRNTEMANSVLRAMQEGKKLMAVAGIAHFLIDNSILDILKQSGCTVAAYP